MAKELFLEIGTEEIPAGFIPKAMTEMEALIRKELNGAHIGFGEVKTVATPRRLTLVVRDVGVEQPTLDVKTLGPAKSVAFDAEGKPTKAAEGFARSQGIDVGSLQIEDTEKGPYVSAVKRVVGRPTAELLVEILPRLINNIPFKKSMRWGDLDVRFVRPIHWIVALFDGIVVPFTFGNIESGSISRGHRFMANTPFPVRDFAHYLEECERHFVIPDPESRKEIIRREIERVARAAGGNVLKDEELAGAGRLSRGIPERRLRHLLPRFPGSPQRGPYHLDAEPPALLLAGRRPGEAPPRLHHHQQYPGRGPVGGGQGERAGPAGPPLRRPLLLRRRQESPPGETGGIAQERSLPGKARHLL